MWIVLEWYQEDNLQRMVGPFETSELALLAATKSVVTDRREDRATVHFLQDQPEAEVRHEADDTDGGVAEPDQSVGEEEGDSPRPVG